MGSHKIRFFVQIKIFKKKILYRMTKKITYIVYNIYVFKMGPPNWLGLVVVPYNAFIFYILHQVDYIL